LQWVQLLKVLRQESKPLMNFSGAILNNISWEYCTTNWNWEKKKAAK
jgi:hypothetical protein